MFGKRLKATSVRRLATGALIGVATAPGYGCGDDSIGPAADISGVYVLQSYDGEKPPVARSSSVLRWGELILNDNGGFSVLFVYTMAAGGTQSDGGGGTYTRSGNQLQFRIPHAGGFDEVHAGSVSGTTVTMELADPAVFRRVLVQ